MSKRPLELAARVAWHIAKNKLRRKKRFPLVTMLEPLEKCNLACEGCGRIREYEPVLDRMLSVRQCMDAVEESGAPIVSIAGGEPTLHPRIDEIVNGIVARKRFVYMCTNALLMERAMKRIPPSKYFCFVVHLDGMEEAHDKSVYRKGVFRIATRAMRGGAGRRIPPSRPTRRCSTASMRTTSSKCSEWSPRWAWRGRWFRRATSTIPSPTKTCS